MTKKLKCLTEDPNDVDSDIHNPLTIMIRNSSYTERRSKVTEWHTDKHIYERKLAFESQL